MFYKTVTGQNWNDRENYDLCIDSSIGIDETVKVLKEFYLKHTKSEAETNSSKILAEIN